MQPGGRKERMQAFSTNMPAWEEERPPPPPPQDADSAPQPSCPALIRAVVPVFTHSSSCGVHSISQSEAGLMERGLLTHHSVPGGGEEGGGRGKLLTTARAVTAAQRHKQERDGEEEEEMRGGSF